MRIYLLSLLVLFFTVSNVQAGLFSPSNEQECIKEYVPKAKTKFTVFSYHRACRGKFKEKPILISKIDEFLCNCQRDNDGSISCFKKTNYNGVVDEPCFYFSEPDKSLVRELKKAWLQKLYEDDYSDLVYSYYLKEVEHLDTTPIKLWEAEKKWADCILNNKKLRDVQTDIGASILIKECNNN